MKLGKIFKITQGHQITDEEIYNSPGDYPIYTGNNDVKGFWDKTIIGSDNLPCLTYPTKAFSGKIYLQSELFDANNTAVMILNEEYKGRVILEYFQYWLPPEFLKSATSKEGVSYLNKEIIENIDVEIPDIKPQIEYVNQFKILDFTKNVTLEIKEKLFNALTKEILLDLSYEKEEQINYLLGYISRNDSLSEEGIYLNRSDKISEEITVLSGNSTNEEYGTINMNTEGIHYINGRQVLHLVTRGKAGKLTYYRKGNYATNTNAFLLYLKEDKLKELGIKNDQDEEKYLKFLIILLQPKFYAVSSNADLSIFPLTEVMKSMKIPIYKYCREIVEIVDDYDKIYNFYDSICEIANELDDLESKQVV